MRELGEDHSVILSTHILSEIQSLCDRVLIINQGHIVLDQPLDQLENSSDKPDSIEISLRNPPALESLLGIEGVASVESINDDTLRINLNSESNVIDAIVEKAASDNWGLFKLNPGDTTLEAIFMRLTHGDNEQPEKEDDAA